MEERAINALAELLFAYDAKDEDFPHNFEVKAVENAVEILKEYRGEKYDFAYFEKVLKEVKEKADI